MKRQIRDYLKETSGAILFYLRLSTDAKIEHLYFFVLLSYILLKAYLI